MCSFKDAYSCKEVRLQCTLVLEGQETSNRQRISITMWGGGRGDEEKKKILLSGGFTFPYCKTLQEMEIQNINLETDASPHLPPILLISRVIL